MKTTRESGCEIYLFGLKKGKDGQYLLDWETTRGDLRDRTQSQAAKGCARERHGFGASVNVPVDFSMRAFCEVMFLDPRMSLFIFTDPDQAVHDEMACVKTRRR
eukprot:6625720-Prymnesium_polylepis.1